MVNKLNYSKKTIKNRNQFLKIVKKLQKNQKIENEHQYYHL